MSLASAIASASSRNGITHATGPKISSRTARSAGSTGASTVGGNQKPGPSGALAARGDGRAVGHVGADGLALPGGDQRAHLRRLVERVADADPLDHAASARP